MSSIKVGLVIGHTLFINPEEFNPKYYTFTAKLDDADILLFEGGGDINPALYKEQNEFSHGIDNWRDALEIEVADKYYGKKLLAGICRGHQILNVFKLGTLCQDIFHAGFNHQHPHRLVSNHPTFCNRITNTAHHQAIKDLGNGLSVVATMKDGVVEAITGNGIRGVQFHPEFNTSHFYDVFTNFLFKI